MKIIGVIGQNGSGKDEVLKYLKAKYHIPFLSTGDMVREIAAKEGKAPTRENLGEISERYFREFGRGCFVKLAAGKIRENNWKIGGITGIRALEDVEALKSGFGSDFILINVYVSDPQERYRRMVKRGEGRDPQSYEQFLRQDAAEEELFHIRSAVPRADYSIANNTTLDGLHSEIDRLVAGKGLLAA